MILLVSKPDLNAHALIQAVKAATNKTLSHKSDVELLCDTFTLDFALQHLSYSFLALHTSSVILQLYQETDLIITTKETVQSDFKMCLITGNLKQWVEIITHMPDSRAIRVFLNDVLAYFDSINYQFLFSMYRRKKLPDQTLLLEHK